MIDRDEFAKVLEQNRSLRALLAAERFMHDALRKEVKSHSEAAGQVAVNAIRDSNGFPTQTWRRATAEQAVMLSVLRRAS